MRVLRCGALWVVSVCAAACGKRPPLCPEAHYDFEIAVAATSVAMSPQVPQVTAHTTSDKGGISVDIVDGVGTVSYEGRGPIPAFLYSAVPWDFIDRTLYAGMGIADGVWYPFWLYCSDDGRLTDFDGEMSDRDVAVLTTVEGTCTLAGGRATPLEIPAHSLRNVALTCGFTVTTTPASTHALELAGSRAGTATFGSGLGIVLPFHTVDCRVSCGDPGWYELHAVVADPVTQTAAFAIYYFEDDILGVQVGNGFRLPLATPYNDWYADAQWALVR